MTFFSRTLIALVLIAAQPALAFNKAMNFVSVADTEHYIWLIGLIKSIHQHNSKNAINIHVIDIGLTEAERNELSKMGVTTEPIKMVHPDLCTKFVVRSNGRLARGWYAWKPVAMYQALKKFKYFIYMDAGKRAIGPLDNIFEVLVKDGYFLMDCGHPIDIMATDYAVQKFNLDNFEGMTVLQSFGVEAGVQGITRKVLVPYVMPLYRLAHKLRCFVDDGTCPDGFGFARHDQALFSIQARLLNYKIHRVNGKGPRTMKIGKKKIRFDIHKYFTYKQFAENPLAEQYHLTDN